MSEATTPTKMILDFSKVKEQSGVNPKYRPAGDYRMKITKVIANKSNAGNDQWVFTFVPTDMQSAAYPYYCQLEEKHLWKIRNLLIACGIDVPKKRVGVDPNKMVGREVGVTLDDDEYEGKMKSVITAVFPSSDLDDEDIPADTSDDDDEVEEEADEEPEPAPVVRKKKPAPKPAPEPEPEADEDEELEELDVEDL